MPYVVVARYRTREGEENTVLPLLDSRDLLLCAPRPEVRA